MHLPFLPVPSVVSFDSKTSVSLRGSFATFQSLLRVVAILSLCSAGSLAASDKEPADPRCIINGWTIPSEGYADQPYIVKTDDGAWLCVMTTGKGEEGAPGQHVISMRSTDQGRSWAKPVDVEPAAGPEASYAVMLKVPGGRIYCFYNHNTDKVSEVKREDGGVYKRVDSLGHHVFKYSDDGGQSWSAKRYDVPVREFECDRKNVYGGSLRFFWNVGRPLVLGDSVFCVLHKVGAMGSGFFAQSEGAFLHSKNILTEHDPEKITFETLPDGEVGLRTPPGGGRISEEQSITSLSDGSLYCVYRTVDGWPACAYSRDGGHKWTVPAYASYTPDGRRMKHPRAANFAWRCSNGKFLYWFHNHGGPAMANSKRTSPYDGRNPVWLVAGSECDSPQGKMIRWSQPEILLYDDNPAVRMSYPDLVEESGKFFVTETQKTIGRVHEIPQPLLEGLFNQWETHTVATNGLVLNLTGPAPLAKETAMPKLPRFQDQSQGLNRNLRTGFTIDIALQLESLEPGQVVLDSRDETGRGILLATSDGGSLKLTLNDGQTESSWDCDRGVLQAGKRHQVAIIVDGGPKIISFVVDGRFCDGGDQRDYGWGRFSPNLRDANGAATLRLGPAMKGSVQGLQIYNRALRTSEAVGNFQAAAVR